MVLTLAFIGDILGFFWDAISILAETAWKLAKNHRTWTTLLQVVIAVSISGALFVGANLIFDLPRHRWRQFATAVGAAAGFVIFLVLDSNRLLRDVAGRPLTWSALGAVIGAIAAIGLQGGTAKTSRVVAGPLAGAAMGVLAGLLMDSSVHPSIGWGDLILWTALLGAAFAAYGFWRRGAEGAVRFALWGGAIGWLFGGWGGADIGDGNVAQSLVLMVVPFAMIGLALALAPLRDELNRIQLGEKARAWIFLGPALFFVTAGLVIPLIRTTYLSFFDAKAEDAVGLDNYQRIFTDKKSVNLSNWEGIFTARVFWIGVVIAVIGAISAIATGRKVGRGFEFNGASLPPLLVGWFLLAFAVLANLRGTVFNNLWWVLTVVTLTTALGLAVAVLADKAKFEKVAKSLVFMPMAISFVGAGIIWRFMYNAKNVSKDQTGVMNAVWVAMGKFTTDDVGKWVSVTVLCIFGALFVALGLAGFRRANWGVLASGGVLMLPVVYLLWRVLDDGYGGLPAGGDESTIQFINTQPYNNVWLMVILIWIQTGFAMVIFSAAIRSVPTELLEAARIDGATESQTFWRVTIPQIAPTIGVVITTLILLVMKVFDIVSVTTNGNFDTQVLANDMWQRAFIENNRGLGSALAIVLFVSVVPVMVYNIRNMQKDG